MSNRSTDCVADYRYVKTIGNAAAPGQIGFRNPVDVALGQGGLLYVLSHAAENTSSGKRIAKCTFDDERFLGEFGSFGAADGQFIWPNSLVVDSMNHRVQKYSREGRFLTQWGGPGAKPGEFNIPGDNRRRSGQRAGRRLAQRQDPEIHC